MKTKTKKIRLKNKIVSFDLKEIKRKKKLLDAENRWIDSHDVKFRKDTRSK